MRKYETGIEPGKCGIYGIEYKELGIVYVGQSKNIHSRLKDHRVQSIKIKKSKEEKKGIGGFIVEMWEENFGFIILKECCLEDLDYYEQYYYEKCGAEKLKNYDSPKSIAGSGINLYAMPEFLKRRAMYYVCKLIDGDCDYDNCVMDVEELIKVDALLKERIPEIIEDMCMGMENQYGIDLIGKYIENSMPVITKFCKVVSDHGKDKNYIGTALWYLYWKLNNKRLSLICNTCFCGYGEAIKAEDIITVEVLEKN